MVVGILRAACAALVAALFFASVPAASAEQAGDEVLLAQAGGADGQSEIYEWTCEKCKGVVGIGATEPNISKCPHCGVALSKATPWWVYVIGGGVALVFLCFRMGLFSRA